MPLDRRLFITSAALGAMSFVLPDRVAAQALSTEKSSMHGLIGRMMAAPGQRDALIEILLDGIHDMPGCLSYVVARDPHEPDSIWITEVWDSKDSHAASLQLPAVRAAIAKGRPLIASFGEQIVTEPVGGFGLVQG